MLSSGIYIPKAEW